MISCENDYCIYWKNNRCILDNVEVEFGGICRSQIVVNIDDETLEKLREKDLKAEE